MFLSDVTLVACIICMGLTYLLKRRLSEHGIEIAQRWWPPSSWLVSQIWAGVRKSGSATLQVYGALIVVSLCLMIAVFPMMVYQVYRDFSGH